VHIVDGEHEGAFGRQVVDQPVEAVEHREISLGLALVECRSAPEQGPRQLRGAREEPLDLGVGGARDRRLEQLPDRAVREIALEHRGAGAQAGETVLLGPLDGRSQQACLAEARRGLSEDHAAVPAGCALESLGEPAELALALEECCPHIRHDA
jgi:hypothetical protein